MFPSTNADAMFLSALCSRSPYGRDPRGAMNALAPKGVEKSKEIAREYFARVREMARKGEIG